MYDSRMRSPQKAPLLVALVVCLAGCEDTPDLDAEALRDPESCRGCHPNHYREWASSMHAYAAEDPVFVAMNARGQRETGGALGDFCVRCHAPVALRTGATKDGLNLAALPRPLRGVTCAFCHQIDAVAGTHNNPLRSADDGVLRGGIQDPVRTGAHRSAYSTLHDRNGTDSASLCGSCHDVVTPAGVPIERSFVEWQASIFGQAGAPAGQRLSCGACHMPGRQALAAQAPGTGLRRVHDHSMPGVDIALSPFPDIEAQTQAVQRDLDPTLAATLCVTADDIIVTLDNVGAGHAFPSGASQDRRAWVEVIAYAGAREVYRSGVVQDGQPVTEAGDPRLFLLRDRLLGAAGQEVHMFWEAASYKSALLPPAVTTDPRDPRFFHAVERRYPISGLSPDRVEMRARIRPLPLEVLDELVASGDLDPAVRGRVPTFSLAGATLTWRRDGGRGCVPE